LEHEFIVRQGDIWTQLEAVMEEKNVDLVVIGTHGQRSLGKMFLGSVAEQIFRHANGPVITVGPATAMNSPLKNGGNLRPFVFATDFAEASGKALPLAVSFANHFGAKLVLVHVALIAPIPEGFHWSRTTTDVRKMQEDIRWPALNRLKEMMAECEAPAIEPEFMVKFGTPSKVIMHVACISGADLIVMGLNHYRYLGASPHMPGRTAYQAVCEAGCSVLTVGN
jgi:nucleotide-binding universal stress UspA family protein